MTSKPLGLAAFTQRPSAEESLPAAEKTRGKGSTVALTVRIPRSDWERLHGLAISEGVSLQSIAIRGLSRNLRRQGSTGNWR